LPAARFYDPATQAFTAVTNDMSSTRVYATATLLPTGKVLLAGGQNNTADLYDPASNSFSPTGNMSVSRQMGAESLTQ
jgi:large repetitive protein